MSSIPPAWLGSIIQTQGAQTRAAEKKSSDAATQAEQTGPNFADNLQDVIEASDRDSQVYADAEGAGSQGRPSEEAKPKPESESDDADKPAGHLDVEA